MEPLFFGTDKRLYGVLHTPPQGICNQAVLICPPVGQEYLRLHRSLVWLSGMLAEKGIGVLRFDYRGTGDSAGVLEKVVADEWLEDGEEAFEELHEQFGSVPKSVIGIRLGALVAAHCSTAQAVERLLLWEACQSGAEFLAELKDDMLTRLLPECNFESNDGTIHHNGFVYSDKLQRSLRSNTILQNEIQRLKTKELLLLDRKIPDKPLIAADASSLNISQHICQVDFSWLDVDVIGSAIIPQKALDNIVKLMS